MADKKSDKDIRVKDDIDEDCINKEIELQIARGFDRGVDYEPMKQKLVECYNKLVDDIEDFKKHENISKIIYSRVIYILVAMIQLRNGSRISEACNAMKMFCHKKNFDDKVVVKIAKSESIKYKNGEMFVTKPRNRKIVFPLQWLEKFDQDMIINTFNTFIPFKRLKKRVLDYLLIHHKCNTHSLRYACINYLIYDMKRPLNDVAKFVGHVDLSMLTKYTQQKNCEKIFELDM